MKKKDLLKEIKSLRRLAGNYLSQIVLLDQKIDDIYRTLKNHGQAHMAQDITPRVKILEMRAETQSDINIKNYKRLDEHAHKLLLLEQTNASENIARICVRLNTLEGKIGLDRQTKERDINDR